MQSFSGGTQAVNWSNVTIKSFESRHALLDRWGSYQAPSAAAKAASPHPTPNGFGWRKTLTLVED